MSEMSQTFVGACLAGSAFLEDVDDWVDGWHESDSEASLDEYLGFTESEGALWAERPESLRFIVAAHRYNAPVATVLESRDDFALAARAGGSDKAAAVLDWLRKTGRV